MRYMFRVLVLGDPGLSLPFVVNGDLEQVSQDSELSRWSKEINIGYEDRCDLEVDVVVSTATDFDNLIPTSDGIVYFIDPNTREDFDLFSMISEIIVEVRREIPIIVVFYNKDGFIKIPTNYLIEYIWSNYPFEVFVFDAFSQNKMYEVLECLSESMVSGSMPLNVETAWLRIPFLIEQINRLVFNEKWDKAARYTELLMSIKKKFGYQDYFINAEQSSWLYYKAGNYIKAADMIADGINERDAEKFKEYYVKDLIHQGDRLKKISRYRSAAEKFEKAALWSSIEIEDPSIHQDAIEKAISTWVAACDFQNAFKLVERLDHNVKLDLMANIAEEIAASADHLIKKGQYAILKSQLYFCIDKYQRAGLFDYVELLADKIVRVLKILLDQDIREGKPDSTVLTLDELYNIWETFNLESQDVDDKIVEIAKLFLSRHEFSIIDSLMPKVQSGSVQAKITELRNEAEENFSKQQQDQAVAEYLKGTELLEEYIKEEVSMFDEITSNMIEYSISLAKDGQNWESALILKERADWFNKMGLKRYFKRLISSVLEIYINSYNPFLIPFLQEVSKLPSSDIVEFLKNHFKDIIDAVKRKSETRESTEKTVQIIKNMIKLFRKHLLYEKSKDLQTVLVSFIVERAAERFMNSKGTSLIPETRAKLKDAEILYSELSREEPLNFDNIYKEMVERYIEAGNLTKARQINETITDKDIFSEFHRQIQEIESEISEKESEVARKKAGWKIKLGEFSNLKNHARDIFMNKENYLKKRSALKRLLYQNNLRTLEEDNYEEALKLYKKTVKTLLRQRKLETASIAFAVHAMLLIKLGKHDKIETILDRIDEQFGISSDIFNETFAVKTIEYVNEMYGYDKEKHAMAALKLLKNLALFPEELELLSEILGEELAESKAETTQKLSSVASTAVSEKQVPSKIFNENALKRFVQKVKNKKDLFTRRKMMKRKYWQQCLEFLDKGQYQDAAHEYMNQIKVLQKNEHDEYVSIAFTMSVLCLLKIDQIDQARRRIEQASMNFGRTHDVLQKMPEYVLMSNLIDASEVDNQEIMDLILTGFIENYPLFGLEKNLIISFLTKDAVQSISDKRTKEKIEKTKSKVILDQHISNLKRSVGDIRSSSEKMLKKRQATKRIYYADILKNLEEENFEQAANHYNSIAKRVTRRNDYALAGILILLGGLCLIKSKKPDEEIKKYLQDFLKGLGFTQKVINETFGVKMLKFIIESRTAKNQSMVSQGWDLLKILPLFDAEKQLIERS